MRASVIIPGEMQTSSMNKSTKAISLVLMGSALALAGCSSRTDDDEDNRVGTNGGHGVYGGSRVIAPRFGGGVSGGRSVSASPSVRGGFGGTGSVGIGS